MSDSDEFLRGFYKGYVLGCKDGYKRGQNDAARRLAKGPHNSCDNCANCPSAADILFNEVCPVCEFWPDCVRNDLDHWKAKED